MARAKSLEKLSSLSSALKSDFIETMFLRNLVANALPSLSPSRGFFADVSSATLLVLVELVLLCGGFSSIAEEDNPPPLHERGLSSSRDFLCHSVWCNC